jgi:hypothetical protein
MACRPASDFYHYGYSARLSGDEPLRFAVARDREAHGSANLGDLFSGKCEGRSVVIVPKLRITPPGSGSLGIFRQTAVPLEAVGRLTHAVKQPHEIEVRLS